MLARGIVGVSIGLVFGAPSAFGQDQDNDGVSDSADAFPCQAGVVGAAFAPAEGDHGLLVFEDQWPSDGDLDFNDAVLAYHYLFRLDVNGRVRSLSATFHPVALGGALSNGFGLHLPLSRGVVASVRRTVGSGAPEDLSFTADGEFTVVVSENLRELFGQASGQINSVPGQDIRSGQAVTLEIELTTPTVLAVGNAPFDVFLFRAGDYGHQIHRPEYSGTMGMTASLFGSGDDGSGAGRYFVNQRGLPFVLVLPVSSAYPQEAVQISTLFPNIMTFAATGGAQARDFYSSQVAIGAAFSGAPFPARLTTPVDRSCLPAVGTAQNPAPSCVDILERGMSLSGSYWLDPNGGAGSDAFLAWCDMDMDGGGWTLAAVIRAGSSFAGGEAIWHTPGTLTGLTPQSAEGKSVIYHTAAAQQVAFRTHQGAGGYWASFDLPGAQTLLNLVGTAGLSQVASGSYRASLTRRAQGAGAHACWNQDWRVSWRDYYSSDGSTYLDSSIFAPSGAASGRPCGGSTAYATGIGVRTDSANGFSGYGGNMEGSGGDPSGNLALTGGYVAIYVRERAPAVVTQRGSWPLACSDISGPDGYYTIDPSGGDPTDAFSVWCDQTTAGGGWTLALVATDPSAWAAGADIWHNRTGTSIGPNTNGKSWAYGYLPGREILIRTQNAASAAWGTFALPARRSLLETLGELTIQNSADNSYRASLVALSQGPAAPGCFAGEWRLGWANYWSSDGAYDSAIFTPAGAASGRPCGGSSAYATGIGVRTDTGNGWVGYGGSYEGSSGESAGNFALTGGYVAIYVRDQNPPAGAPVSCAQVTGPTGLYWLDPTGGDAQDAYRGWCDMDTDGGGWTLAWVSSDPNAWAAGATAWHQNTNATLISPSGEGKSPAYAQLTGTQILFRMNRGAAGNWASFQLPAAQTLLQLVGTTPISSVASGSYRATLTPRARGNTSHACWGENWRVTWRDYWSADAHPDSAIFAPAGAANGRPCGGSTSWATGIGVRTDTNNGFDGYGGSFEGWGADHSGNPAVTGGYGAIYIR